MDCLIVDTDTLRAQGLRYMLEDRYSLSSVLTSEPERADGIDENTIFFVTAEAFASQPYFYVPRRERVVLIGSMKKAPLPVIDPAADETEICEKLDMIVRALSHRSASQLHTPLSDREKEVLRQVALGMTNKEIATCLNISFNTVLTHRRNIMDKLGIRTVAGLIIYAVMNGLVSQTELSQHIRPGEMNL